MRVPFVIGFITLIISAIAFAAETPKGAQDDRDRQHALDPVTGIAEKFLQTALKTKLTLRYHFF